MSPILAAFVELVDAGAVGIDISESRPLADLAEVHRLSEAGRIRGKVLVVPRVPGGRTPMPGSAPRARSGAPGPVTSTRTPDRP
ncbi:zinc-binding dehydrogenase [Streptomyces sp. NRRL B-24572]|uniref:zinc-binding dehydrogenase n=1 Tax=Streptomyces sp. NRRL B-24572 TaxID=1962156 RepID=UPI00211AF607|nr:zinc-binding dehydrogenase [Streptomyces sp. NRRL B-24572]